MAKSDGMLAMAAICVAAIAAQGGLGVAGASPVSMVLLQQIGQPITMNGLYVDSVPADEGFWVDSDHGRMWVQIDTPYESPYEVDPGDVVNISGTVVRNDQSFPVQVGVTSDEGAADLAAAGAHISIPVHNLTFADTAA